MSLHMDFFLEGIPNSSPSGLALRFSSIFLYLFLLGSCQKWPHFLFIQHLWSCICGHYPIFLLWSLFGICGEHCTVRNTFISSSSSSIKNSAGISFFSLPFSFLSKSSAKDKVSFFSIFFPGLFLSPILSLHLVQRKLWLLWEFPPVLFSFSLLAQVRFLPCNVHNVLSFHSSHILSVRDSVVINWDMSFGFSVTMTEVA